ncbi:MAG: alpha/beta hydrolase [Candidatus Obscuribacterales bacterium]|nr:alpha/beta hydrolase [Candidatus Obscuribacterales bacterium]
MGNRLINWYFLSRYDRNQQNPPKFKEVVLTSPEIDRATFKNYFFKVAGNAAKTRIYISYEDLPLRLPKFVQGGARVGSAITEEENKWDMPGNIRSAQTINFSTIDSGRLGHSIQYKVISSMHKSDKPGDGLIAEEDKTYKGNYLLIRRTSK